MTTMQSGGPPPVDTTARPVGGVDDGGGRSSGGGGSGAGPWGGAGGWGGWGDGSRGGPWWFRGLSALLGGGVLAFMVTGAFVVLFFDSIVATVLWFCFDDALARAVGLPGLGEIPTYAVWLAIVFVFWVTGRRSTYERASGSRGARRIEPDRAPFGP